MDNMVTLKHFCNEANIKVPTLRKYIQLGLIPHPEKRGQYVGYYNRSDIHTIRTIQKLNSLGVKMSEIRKIYNGSSHSYRYPDTICIYGITYKKEI